jgi:integrase
MPKKTWVDKLPAPKNAQEDYAAPGSQYGLWARVFSSGRKVWFIRGRVKGAGKFPKFIDVGDCALMPQEDAELEAGKKRRLLRQGIDPNKQRDEAAVANRVAAMTFEDLSEEYIEKDTAKLSPRTLTVRRNVLRGKHFVDWRPRPLTWITQGRVDALAAAIPETASYSPLSTLRVMLRYAEDHGYIAKAPKVKVPKAQGDAAPFFQFQEGAELNSQPKADFTELAVVLEALDTLKEQNPLSPWPAIWRFAALTGARPTAYLGARWEEFDLSSTPWWHLPAVRSKLKRGISIPLSDGAAALLRAIPRKESGLIWPGRDGTKAREDLPGDQVGLIRGMLAARGFREGFWPGRFRDTVMTWLDVNPLASERAIALVVDHKAPAERTTRGRHYAKFQSDQLARQLVNDWAAVVANARSDAQPERAVVLSMRREKRASDWR